VAVGALYCAAAIAAGAFGAHGLRGRLDAAALALWETAARYLMYAGLGVTLIGLAHWHAPRPGFALAAPLAAGGGLVFSVTVAALALGGPRWLGAVTPIGGLGLILAFLVFAWSALRG
jgi:uncharacterized membrane protein YgdD (TMEM256/DUF423 family)